MLEIYTNFKYSSLKKINPSLLRKKKQGSIVLFWKGTLSIPGSVL